MIHFFYRITLTLIQSVYDLISVNHWCIQPSSQGTITKQDLLVFYNTSFFWEILFISITAFFTNCSLWLLRATVLSTWHLCDSPNASEPNNIWNLLTNAPKNIKLRPHNLLHLKIPVSWIFNNTETKNDILTYNYYNILTYDFWKMAKEYTLYIDFHLNEL